jgi:hypothetical protein
MNDPLEIPRLNAETLIPDAVATASGATARAEGGLWPILLQKSVGSVRSHFPGPWECPSKKRVGDHPIYWSLNERLPHPRYDSFE